MVDATSAAEPRALTARPTQEYATIVIVGGGCYGSYYLRQLGRAHAAGALSWERILVVDRDAGCAVARLTSRERPPAVRCIAADWRAFFTSFLDEAGARDACRDAIVPSPLMPHLMADWLLERALARWPERAVGTTAIGEPVEVPWQRAGEGDTHYVSFAEWMCPINCIEPARCPATRDVRHWSMPPALARHVETARARGARLGGPFVFHCTHRAYGVGMIDVADVVAADRAIALAGEAGPTRFLVATASHCHGAIRVIDVGA